MDSVGGSARSKGAAAISNVLSARRTRFKSRIQGALARYNIQLAVRDTFGAEGRRRLTERLPELPAHTRQSVALELVAMDFIEDQIDEVEKQLDVIMGESAAGYLLKTLPYVGRILSMVITLEIGCVERFPRLNIWRVTPVWCRGVQSSGDHTCLGQICGDVNHNF